MAAAALGELNLFKIFIYYYRKTLINPPFFIPPPRDYAAGFLTPESSMSSIQLFGFCVRCMVAKNLNLRKKNPSLSHKQWMHRVYRTIFLAQKSVISGSNCSIWSICSKLFTEIQIVFSRQCVRDTPAPKVTHKQLTKSEFQIVFSGQCVRDTPAGKVVNKLPTKSEIRIVFGTVCEIYSSS